MRIGGSVSRTDVAELAGGAEPPLKAVESLFGAAGRDSDAGGTDRALLTCTGITIEWPVKSHTITPAITATSTAPKNVCEKGSFSTVEESLHLRCVCHDSRGGNGPTAGTPRLAGMPSVALIRRTASSLLRTTDVQAVVRQISAPLAARIERTCGPGASELPPV